MSESSSEAASDGTAEGTGGRRTDTKALIFIFITVFLDVVGLGIIIPVTPELVMELTGEGIGAAAYYGGWLLGLYALMQFLFAPVIGNLSDRFGRRPVLLLSLFAFGIDYIVMALAPTIHWLFAGRVIAGITGATTTTASAYIADASAPEDRAKNFGLIGAAFGLGFIFGPVIGGLLGELGSRVPFFAAAALSFLNLAYGYFVLPETLKDEERRPFTWARANPIGMAKSVSRYPLIIALAAVLVFYQLAHDANPAVWTYYTMLKFDWSEWEVGLSLGLVGLLIAIVQGGMTRVIVPRLGEKRTAYLGLALGAAGFLGFAFASESWVMIAWMVPWAFMGLASPAIRGIMANQVPDNAQGELQGAIASVIAVTAIVAPLIMTFLFRYFTEGGAPVYFPGASFFAAGVLMIIGALLLTRARH